MGCVFSHPKSMEEYTQKRLKAMQPEVDRRLAEERDHSRGEQVWFSRYIENGRLRHWVLMTHGFKYELRRSKNVEEEKGEECAGGSKFTYHVTPCTIDEQKRQAVLAETSLPYIDGFYVCLVGWTNKSKAEVDDACRTVHGQFGEYHLLWKNCQHFLRALADQIIDTKAADFNWFKSNTKTRYQKTQSLMPPPLALLLKMQRQSQAASLMYTHMINYQIQTQIQMLAYTQMQFVGGMGA